MLDHNPFTTTPGVAGEAYINPHHAENIIKEFESPYSTQYVFKLLGQRGSGKSVEYAKILNHFAYEEKWKVYSVSAAGDPTSALISSMMRDFSDLFKIKDNTTELSAEANASTLLKTLEGKGSVVKALHSSENALIYSSDEATLKALCQAASHEGYKILIGIDDIAKTDNMVKFLSILGTFFTDSKINIRLICTGLYKNIEDFVSEDSNSLSFFVRPEPIVVKEIEKSEFKLMYMNLLGANTTDALEMAEICKGYAWAYQLLGDILYKRNKKAVDDKILEEFDNRMAATYSLVWKSLTDAEQILLKILVNNKTEKRSEAEAQYNSGGFGTIKQRLEAKHVISSYKVGTEGYIKVTLPRMKEYIDEYH